jgi:hypothetical protein
MEPDTFGSSLVDFEKSIGVSTSWKEFYLYCRARSIKYELFSLEVH